MNIKSILNTFGFLFAVTILIQGCYKNVGEEIYPEDCDTINVTYSGSVEPIIRNNCYTCHDLAAQPSGIRLQGYSNIKVKVDDEKLVCAINHFKGCQPMPQQGGKLSACNIRIIEKWIEDGAQDN